MRWQLLIQENLDFAGGAIASGAVSVQNWIASLRSQ